MKALAWLGTVSSVIGAFLVASKLPSIGYCLFLVGSASWLIVGASKRDYPLVVLNVTFLLANILGVYNYVL